MTLWLFKEEPDHYSFADLERDGATVWDGVSNALALRYLNQVKPGDRVLFYHTGKEKAVVGEMRVVAGPTPVLDAGGTGGEKEAKGTAVTVEPVRRWPRAVPLTRIKADPAFAGWELVRLPRLSVMPVSEDQWARLQVLGEVAP